MGVIRRGSGRRVCPETGETIELSFNTISSTGTAVAQNNSNNFNASSHFRLDEHQQHGGGDPE